MKLLDALAYAAGVMRDPSALGAIAPSSPALARAMVSGLDLGPGRAIAEFGPGTGAFTATLSRAMLGASYVGLEIDPVMVAVLRQRFPRLLVLQQGAETLAWPVDVIVSGLPFTSLPPSVQDAVVATIGKRLRPGGVFRTFNYLHAYPMAAADAFRAKMQPVLGAHRIVARVVDNMPPALVLEWRRGGG